MRIRSIAAVLGVATALAGTQTAVANDGADGGGSPPDSSSQANPNPNPPRFKPGFLNRVWRFNGSVDAADHGSLSMTLDSIERLPARFRTQDDDLVDQDMTVLFSESVRVYDPDGHLVAHDELERAESVQVRGRLLRPRKWRANEDGDYVPTVRAKRIYVTAWVPRSDSDPAEEPQDEWSDDDGEPADDCHHAAARRDAEVVAACW